MITIVLAAGIVLFAQVAGPAGLELPFVITLKDSDERVYGFVDEKEFQGSRSKAVMVVLDEPWKGRQERQIRLSKIESHYQEGKIERAIRIEEGWRAHDGVQVETENGLKWVSQTEADLAWRARELAGVDRVADRADSEAVQSVAADVPVSRANPRSGFFGLWGKHLAVTAIAAALTALVAWTLRIKA